VEIVLSDNILLLLIFWELTSITSFLLIGYWKHLPEGRQGARMVNSVPVSRVTPVQHAPHSGILSAL